MLIPPPLDYNSPPSPPISNNPSLATYVSLSSISPSPLAPTRSNNHVIGSMMSRIDETLLIPYDMRMSSMYSSSGNYLENLNDSDDGLVGVCTGKAGEDEYPFVQLIFRDCVCITRMIIGACTLNNWGPNYLQSSEIQFLNKSNHQWEYLAMVTLEDNNPNCEIILANPVETNSIRVRSDIEYIGLGQWKCFGHVVEQQVVRGLEIEKVPLDQTSFIDMVSIPYRLMMSSKYPFCENTFGSLVDGSDYSIGAATNNDFNSYIEAIFLTPAQPITHIEIKPLTKKDWGVKYSHNLLLEYSDNGVDWKLMQKLIDINEKSAPIALYQATVSTHWRLRRVEEGFVSLGLLKFYTYFQIYNYKPIPVGESIARPISYSLTMSDSDESCANTFEALQDPSGNSGGAGTGCGVLPFIQVSFDRVYTLVSLNIRPVRKADWGGTYLRSAQIKYSENGNKWFDSVSLSNVSEDLTTIVLDNISAKYLRIIKDDGEKGYVGVGSLIVNGI